MTDSVLLTTEQRFWGRVEVAPNGCLEWMASLYPNGYGQFTIGRRHMVAHRWSYEHDRGPVPAGLELDHLCRNRRCVNPDHLEPVTRSINQFRGESPKHIARRTGKCQRGHAKPYPGECRECRVWRRQHGSITDDRERRWYLMVGASLYLNRTQRGMTIYDVAAIADATGKSVSLWERGIQRMRSYQYDLLRREGLLND